jgi:hypothetical protein
VAEPPPSPTGPVPPGERTAPRAARSGSHPFFTAPLRGGGTGPDALARWERVLARERSPGFAALRILSRVPALRDAMGLPPLEPDGPRTLEEREATLAAVRDSGLVRRGRALHRRLRRRDATAAGAPAPATAPAPQGPQTAGPLTDRLVDEAIAVLRSVPFEEVQRRGWHFQPNHFYWPLNDVSFLDENRDLWHDRGLPHGIRWDVDGQLALVERLDAYRGELADVPRLPRAGQVEFVWENNAFGGADAVVYYGLVRSLAPRRVVEVGAGWSSLLLARALARNETPCDVTLVEPHPDARLFGALPADWEVHERTLQRTDLRVFERLGAGDVLMFDGSHCVRTASDVNWLLFEVMPRLSRGVYVHVHDVLFPEDYMDRWILDEGLSWNEQYVVQALLMHSDAYAVRIANHMLWTERREAIDALHGGDGTSLWLEKLAEAEPTDAGRAPLR